MDDMTDQEYPVTIRDNEGFETLVTAWKHSGIWDDFAQVYEGKRDVPTRLKGFTILTSVDPTEPYGALLQVIPAQAQKDRQTEFAGRKLLAKVRLI